MARILIIDDEEGVRRAMRRFLELEGHHVVEAGDGRAGIQLYDDDPADLVITDLFMPEQDGLETIRALKRTYKDIRILAITGMPRGGRLDFRAHAVRLGAQQTLTKPFTREELLEAVEKLLTQECT
jgi:CheY-like chemotaxis protein